MARRQRRRSVPRTRRRQKGGGLLPLLALGGLTAGWRYQKRRKKNLKKWGTTTQRGQGLLEAALTGVELGRSKKYKRMGAVGAKGHYTRRYAPWEV